MKLVYVLSVILMVNALLAASLNMKRPKRNLVWVKNMIANLFGYKRPQANHRIMYTVPEYFISQPATIAPQYMNQNIYQGTLTNILIPCYMQNQPFVTFQQQNIPVYTYNTDECNYRTKLNSDYLNINGPQYSPYPLKYYGQIQNPETIRSDKQIYSRNMEPVLDKFNEKPSQWNEQATPAGPKIQNYQDEEKIRSKVGSAKAPELTVTKNNSEGISTSTTSATSTTPVTPTTSAIFTNSAPSTISATSTTSATSLTSATSTTPVTFTNSATSTISDTPSATATISTTLDTSTSSAFSTKSLVLSTFSSNQNSTQTPAVTTTNTTDSGTFSVSTLTTTMATPIVNTIDTLAVSEIVTTESIRGMSLLNSSTDSTSSKIVSFQTTTPISLAQTDSTPITEEGKTKELPIFTNSLKITTSSNIILNESDVKNATKGMTDPLGITELNNQSSTGRSFTNGEINITDTTTTTTTAVPLNSVLERNFTLSKSEEPFAPHEKKENYRGDIPDMTT